MRLAAHWFFVVVIALGVGVGSAWWATNGDPKVGLIEVGPWAAWIAAGSSGPDPYTLATIARIGLLPMPITEGAVFYAETDTSGARLTSNCTYMLEGAAPPSRLWTISAISTGSASVASQTMRGSLLSSNLIWRDPTMVQVAASEEPQAENWLAIRDGGPFRLVLRLYELTLALGEGQGRPIALPVINRGQCR